MPRPEYYNLRRSPERQARTKAIAEKLGLDIEKPSTWGAVFDWSLGLAFSQLNCLSEEVKSEEVNNES